MSARPAILLALVMGTTILALAQIASSVSDEPISTFTRDFQVTAHLPWYTGWISVLNGMVWAAVAALSLFVASLIPSERRRLVLFGGFVLVLAADDALVVHDVLGPDHGIPQAAFIAAYGVVALLLAWWMLQGASEVALAFFLGAALLGVSAAMDQLLSGVRVFEEGAKLLGALVWVTVPLIASQALRIEPGDGGNRSIG